MSPTPRRDFEVLVTAASKRGATSQISQLIADTLVSEGITTSLMPVEEVVSINAYDAVIAGSAIYGGRWLEPARRFLEEHCEELRHRMVWLFSAGPIGQPGARAGTSREAVRLCAMVDPLEHKVFSAGIPFGIPDFKSPEAPHSAVPLWNPDEVRRWALCVGGAVYAAATTLSDASLGYADQRGPRRAWLR